MGAVDDGPRRWAPWARRPTAIDRVPFTYFTAALLFAGAADALVTVSLAGSLFFNLSPDASRSQVLLYLSITMVPFAVLAPLVGPAIDRYRRGDRVVASMFFALRAVCALGLAVTLFELSFYVFALALLVASKASGVVRQALVPRLVIDQYQLVEANSYLARIGAIVGGIAGAAGAWMLSVTSAQALLDTAAVLFGVSALIALRVMTVAADQPPPPSLEYAELHAPMLVTTSAGLMALRAGVGYFVFMLAFALRRDNEPAWVFGVAVASYGAGSFAGNVVAPILRRRWGEDRLMGAALAGAAVVAAIGALGINRRSLVVVAVVLGLAATVGRQAFDSLLQRSAPDALRGQVFARYETWFQLTWVLGGVLATAITLSIELGMAVLTVLFVPIVVVYARGVREAERFAAAPVVPPVDEALAPAHARFVTAEAWWRAGNARLAVVEAAATVDLALAARAADGERDGRLVDDPTSFDPVVLLRLAELRRHALDPDGVTGAAEVDEALALAAKSVGLSPPVPSSGSPTSSDSPPG